MDNNIWQIDVKDGKVLIYNKQEIESEEIFVLSKDTLIKSCDNEISPLTAFSNEPNEKGEMCSLIELKNKTEDKKVYLSKKPDEKYLAFLSRLDKFLEFFSKDYPTKIIVSKNNCVIAHSVNAIGLYSDNFHGDVKILHAFFSIGKNESLKEPAIEFSIYVIKGNGMIVMDNEKYPIEKNTYYHLIRLCCNVTSKGIYFSHGLGGQRWGKAVKIHIKSKIGASIIKVCATEGDSPCL